MTGPRKCSAVFASLLLAVACQAAAQQKTFRLDKPMQEDIVACMQEEAAERLFAVDQRSTSSALPDGCFRFVTTVTYKKLVHSHVTDGVTYSVYEATVRSFSVFVPMKGYVHEVL